MAATMETAAQFLEEVRDALVKAFMSAPQMDAHLGARVPADFGVSTKTARRRVQQNNDGSLWALSPNLPLTTSC